MLAGAIVGVPAQAGATSSTDVRQPQRAGCIATPSEFDLLQTQHSEYIFDRLARPRDIREFLSEKRRRATKQECGCGPTGRRGGAVSTRGYFCCVAGTLAECLTQPAFALDPRDPDWAFP